MKFICTGLSAMGVHQALAYTSLGTGTALLKPYIPIKNPAAANAVTGFSVGVFL